MTKKIFLSALAVAVSLSFAVGSAEAKTMKPMTKSHKMMMTKKPMMTKSMTKKSMMKKSMTKKAM